VPGYRVRNHSAGTASGLVPSARGAGGLTAPARGPLSHQQNIAAAISSLGEGWVPWVQSTPLAQRSSLTASMTSSARSKCVVACQDSNLP
jgi:hypothetical protein